MFRQGFKPLLQKTLRAISNIAGLSNVNSAVPVVCVMGIGTMLVIATAEWTLLLYLNHIGFTNPADSSFYIFAFAMALVVPVFANVILGIATSYVGPGTTLAGGCLFVALGMLTLVISRSSKVIFLIGYAMYSCTTSLRIIRLAIISMVVSPEDRTSVMAVHQLMAPIGAVLGPMLWLLLQLWQGHIVILSNVIVMDRFSINYTISGLVMLGISALAFQKLRVIGSDGNNDDQADCEDRRNESTLLCKSRGKDYGSSMLSADSRNPHPSPTAREDITSLSDGHERKVDARRYRMGIFLFFCALKLGVSLTMGMFNVAFQPILINHFKANDAKVAMIFTIVGVLAIIPPIMVAAMSRVMKDRQILLFGLFLKLIGAMIFLPVFGKEVKEWQVVAGFVLVVKGSTFFTVATISIFTKILGRMSSSSLLSWLWSVRNIGPAIAQLLLSSTIVNHFGGWVFGIYGLPCLFSLALALSPLGWRLLDPDSERTLSLFAAQRVVDKSHWRDDG